MQYFSSRDVFHRAPGGAVPAGTRVHFRLRLPRTLRCAAARLLIWAEREDADGALCPAKRTAAALYWCGMAGEEEHWECHFTPDTPGLYGYAFALETAAGIQVLRRRADASAALEPAGGEESPAADGRWQLTCYGADFATPGWLAGGVMYQIFPDRYAASGAPKEGVPSGRELRDDWGGAPRAGADGAGRWNNDYFGGDLAGIEARLDRLAALGVTCLYLNPLFEAHSNHRYDTADYERIDPLLGDGADFRRLCGEAAKRGIRVLLDGVFSHTGADSRYFNRYGRYPAPGAYQSAASPWAAWYTFRRFPDDYAAWWGVPSLPEVNEEAPSYMAYINGEGGIVRRWLAAGGAGWRLDVADELPDGFLRALRAAAKAEDPAALVLGEVWEDASNKVSYGRRRAYLLGRQLDSVMNYPFAAAILAFLRGGGGDAFHRVILDIAEHYPPPVLRLLMNHIGTHDTPRALTALGGDRQLLRLAALLQYTLPGVPCVYYGDEAGMEGGADPANRGCYPWGAEDDALLAWYRQLGALRRRASVLREGVYRALPAPEGVVMYERADANGALLTAVNPTNAPTALPLPSRWQRQHTPSLGEARVDGSTLHLPPKSGAVLEEGQES